MHIKLSDNIRAFRKAHSLTQQQLADALGVTVGAVYKWEANLSAPDLSLLIELADLFDTSVDVLLGYEIKSNKQAATVARLKEYLHRKDKAGLAESEKALLRYPNSFDVVHQSATLYYLFGIMTRDEAVEYLSIALVDTLASFVRIACGYMNVYFKKNDFSAGSTARGFLKETG